MTTGAAIPTTSDLPPRPLGLSAAEREAVAPLRRRQRRAGEPAGASQFVLYTVLAVGVLIMLTPFAYMISTSLKSEPEASSARLNLIPRDGVHWSNYPAALAPDHMDFWPALANTIVITCLTLAGQVISSSLVGFGFARFRFRGRRSLFLLMLSTMMLPSQVTLIPVFILFRMLGWIDTIWPLVIPAWLASPFFVYMFRQFFAQVPQELMEAARLDGASSWGIYWRLLMPLCKPVIAVVAIYTFLGSWNDYLGPLIYLNSPSHRTLALALDGFRGQYGVHGPNLLMAASIVTMLPCVILFFAAQKYFVESVAATGLKG